MPVGLTKFRNRLPKIEPVNKAYSKRIIQLVEDWQKSFRRKWGHGFVYAADEFFTQAELDFPGKEYYDEFYQIENGVGMMRQFLDNFDSKQRLLPRRLKKKLKITLVTGVSAFRLIRDHRPEVKFNIRSYDSPCGGEEWLVWVYGNGNRSFDW